MTPSPDPKKALREQLFVRLSGCGPEVDDAIAVVMAVVQPALDAKDAEIERLTVFDPEDDGKRCEVCGSPVMWGSRHSQCGHALHLATADLKRELDAANRALAAVRELHPNDGYGQCTTCALETGFDMDHKPWPCPTSLAASPNPEQGRTEP